MTRRHRHGCVAAWLLCGTVAALAQDSATARPNPLDAGARVPSVTYQSSLRGYPRLTDQDVGSWKAVNETVNRIGGWRTYAREAQAPAAGASSAAQPVKP